MSDTKRTSSNFFFLVVFVILNMILPAFFILWGSGRFDPFPRWPFLGGAVRLLLFFFVYPVGITYFVISLKRFFPRETKKALWLFVPYFANLVVYALRLGFSAGFFSLWLFQTLPLFLGYMTCLLGGFVILIVMGWRDLMQAKIGEIFLAFILITAFSLAFLGPLVFVFSMGWVMVQKMDLALSAASTILMYLLSITMVILFHFPIIRRLYREGEL